MIFSLFIYYLFSEFGIRSHMQRIVQCGTGSANVPKEVDEVCIDKENLLVTTPAYMCDAPIDRVFEGMVDFLKK